MKIAIAGGTGFIGAHLIRHLRQKSAEILDDELFTQQSFIQADDFLADVCRQWEREADQIPADRGAFPKLALPYRFFFGGRIGSGRQWMSWIHIEDAVRLIAFCVQNETTNGAVNMTAPEPVTNDEFGRALARRMGRPHWVTLPSFVLKAALGEMSNLLITGQKAVPQKLLKEGFSFTYPTVNAALENLVQQLSVKK